MDGIRAEGFCQEELEGVVFKSLKVTVPGWRGKTAM